MYPRVGLEGWLRWSAHPIGAVVFRGPQYPAIPPNSLLASLALHEWELGCLVSL